MKNVRQLEPKGKSYQAPAVNTILFSSRQSILTGSNGNDDNSIQEYGLEEGEW